MASFFLDHAQSAPNIAPTAPLSPGYERADSSWPPWSTTLSSSSARLSSAQSFSHSPFWSTISVFVPILIFWSPSSVLLPYFFRKYWRQDPSTEKIDLPSLPVTSQILGNGEQIFYYLAISPPNITGVIPNSVGFCGAVLFCSLYPFCSRSYADNTIVFRVFGWNVTARTLFRVELTIAVLLVIVSAVLLVILRTSAAASDSTSAAECDATECFLLGQASIWVNLLMLSCPMVQAAKVLKTRNLELLGSKTMNAVAWLGTGIWTFNGFAWGEEPVWLSNVIAFFCLNCVWGIRFWVVGRGPSGGREGGSGDAEKLDGRGREEPLMDWVEDARSGLVSGAVGVDISGGGMADIGGGGSSVEETIRLSSRAQETGMIARKLPLMKTSPAPEQEEVVSRAWSSPQQLKGFALGSNGVASSPPPANKKSCSVPAVVPTPASCSPSRTARTAPTGSAVKRHAKKSSGEPASSSAKKRPREILSATRAAVMRSFGGGRQPAQKKTADPDDLQLGPGAGIAANGLLRMDSRESLRSSPMSPAAKRACASPSYGAARCIGGTPSTQVGSEDSFARTMSTAGTRTLMGGGGWTREL